MIARFCLYGFLKNLRLFEAFLLLALRDRGLDYFEIGTLVAVRELTVNLLEIPSGALADTLGRKRCMVASFAAYVAAYVALGLGSTSEPSWGVLIEQARFDLGQGVWWQMLATSGVVFGLSLAINLFGEAARDALDPKGTERF